MDTKAPKMKCKNFELNAISPMMRTENENPFFVSTKSQKNIEIEVKSFFW